MHGYAIKQSFDSVPINNNTLYTALNKFVKKGYVTREFVPVEDITGLSNYKTVAEHISQRIENEKEFINKFCRERGITSDCKNQTTKSQE